VHNNLGKVCSVGVPCYCRQRAGALVELIDGVEVESVGGCRDSGRVRLG
jgi:hypothetical protein